MPHEPDALREQWLALMANAPVREYSEEPGIYSRVGIFLARQAEAEAIEAAPGVSDRT